MTKEETWIERIARRHFANVQSLEKKREIDALRSALFAGKAWLDERDRFYRADVPKTPASALIRFGQKTDEAREAFRAKLKEIGL